MKRYWIYITAIILLLLTAGCFYYLYQKPRASVANLKADHSLSAEKLYDDFVSDEAAADQKYTGKILEVKGVVIDAQLMDSTGMVLLAAGNNTGGINCNLQDNNVQLPAIGETIVVKGKCTGLLMDVNLVDVVFEKR